MKTFRRTVALLAGAAAFMMFSPLSAYGAADNPPGGVVTELPAGDYMNTNEGTILANYGTVIDNYGLITDNFSFVADNYGTVTNNYGGIVQGGGTVTNTFYEIIPTVLGTGEVTIRGAVAVDFKEWVLSGGSVTFIPSADSAVVVTDAGGGTVSQSGRDTVVSGITGPVRLLVGVLPVITTQALPNGTVGQAYTATLAADSETSVTWRLASGSALPVWATLNGATGVISGTPTVAETGNFRVIAENSVGTDEKLITFRVDPPPQPPVITTTALSTGQQCVPYRQALSATGAAPITWRIEGSLPDGLSLTENVIEGTPTLSGTSVFTVIAENAVSTASRTYSLVIAPGTPVALPSFVPAGGQYTMPLSVSIFCATPGAVIHYTTDGSAPSQASPVYTVPLSIQSGTTLRARAFLLNYCPSDIASAAYFPVSAMPSPTPSPSPSPTPSPSSCPVPTCPCHKPCCTPKCCRSPQTGETAYPAFSFAVLASCITAYLPVRRLVRRIRRQKRFRKR